MKRATGILTTKVSISSFADDLAVLQACTFKKDKKPVLIRYSCFFKIFAFVEIVAKGGIYEI